MLGYGLACSFAGLSGQLQLLWVPQCRSPDRSRGNCFARILPTSGSYTLPAPPLQWFLSPGEVHVCLWALDVQSVTPVTLTLFKLTKHKFLLTADPCTKKLPCDSLRAVLIRGYRDTNLEGSLILCLNVINRFCTFNFALSEKDFTNWCIQLSTYKSQILTTRTEFIQRMDKVLPSQFLIFLLWGRSF